MADHRAQQIIDALTTILTGLATTGANVSQLRGYPVLTTPAITVQKGTDAASNYLSNSFVDRSLEIDVVIHVAGDPAEHDESLNQIAKEVYVAIMADTTLGLTFVIDALLVTDNAPTNQPDAEQPTVIMLAQWLIKYRHSLTDPSA